jgi:predicted nucleic acid-binding protein
MNGLAMAVRRKRIAFDDVLEFAELMSSLPIEIEPATTPDTWRSLLVLAKDTRLTIYDASYLQLARDRNVALATFDRELQSAAQAASVPLLALA